jgi:hypothetical protein
MFSAFLFGSNSMLMAKYMYDVHIGQTKRGIEAGVLTEQNRG